MAPRHERPDVVCVRVDDMPTRPREATTTMVCEQCGTPVYAADSTIALVQQHDARIVCLRHTRAPIPLEALAMVNPRMARYVELWERRN